MAKKLTKAQIAKNPTAAINSGKMKMNKQEVSFSGIGKVAGKVVSKVAGKSASKMAKKPSKVSNKIVKYYQRGGTQIGGPGAVIGGKKVVVREQMTNKVVKGKARKIFDSAQRTELESLLNIPRRKSVLEYPPKKFRSVKSYTTKPTTPKVPVKPKASRTRSGKKSK